MKYKNKKTGEVRDWDFGDWYQKILNPDNKENYECSLADFIDRVIKFKEEWEDYEEPKEYWFIDAFGNIIQNRITKHRGDEYTDMSDDYERQKEIGNYFETKEEVEEAVEKLKAWKRLKDKGFEFMWVDKKNGSVKFGFFNKEGKITEEMWQDIDLLFGGEE